MIIYYNKAQIANSGVWYLIKVSLPKKRLFPDDVLPAPYILSVLTHMISQDIEWEYSTSQPSLILY